MWNATISSESLEKRYRIPDIALLPLFQLEVLGVVCFLCGERGRRFFRLLFRLFLLRDDVADRLLRLLEEPAPKKKQDVEREREDEENLERVVGDFAPDFVPALERLLAHAPDSLGENAEAVVVIEEYARGEFVAPVERPKVLLLYSLAYNRERRRRLVDCRYDVGLAVLREIADVTPDNPYVRERLVHVPLSLLERLLPSAEEENRFVVLVYCREEENRRVERVVAHRNVFVAQEFRAAYDAFRYREDEVGVLQAFAEILLLVARPEQIPDRQENDLLRSRLFENPDDFAVKLVQTTDIDRNPEQFYPF